MQWHSNCYSNCSDSVVAFLETGYEKHKIFLAKIAL